MIKILTQRGDIINMSLFKAFRGTRASLDTLEKHDGYAYFCTDDGTFHIDYVDSKGNLQRKQINEDVIKQAVEGLATEDYVDEKIANLGSALNTFVLTDKSTEVAYELCIIDGKLTLTETVSRPVTVNEFMLTDKNTNITYELSVIDGKLTLMEQGG